MSKVRIGCVSYLNSKVLIHGVPAEGDDHVLSLDAPSRLAEQLAAGEIDVGLIPAFEFFHIPDLVIVPNASISARGSVDSVKLFARAPLAELKTVALDTSSRSSAALVKILLNERHRITPDIVDLDPTASEPPAAADAYMLIGDPCLKHSPPADVEAYDLAQLWWDLVRAPFVFAFWACHKDTDLRGADRMLREAKAAGLAATEQIAQTASEELGIEFPMALDYITKRIGYDLSPKEMAGFQAFYRYAVKNGMAEERLKFELYNR